MSNPIANHCRKSFANFIAMKNAAPDAQNMCIVEKPVRTTAGDVANVYCCRKLPDGYVKQQRQQQEPAADKDNFINMLSDKIDDLIRDLILC